MVYPSDNSIPGQPLSVHAPKRRNLRYKSYKETGTPCYHVRSLTIVILFIHIHIDDIGESAEELGRPPLHQ